MSLLTFFIISKTRKASQGSSYTWMDAFLIHEFGALIGQFVDEVHAGMWPGIRARARFGVNWLGLASTKFVCGNKQVWEF